MDESKISVRYAKAFFTLTKEKQKLEEIKKDVELISKLSAESAEFILLLESPVIKTSQKIRLIQAIFKDKVDQLSLNFLTLIHKNKRETYIPGICRNFMNLYRKNKGIKSAVITSAISLNDDILKQIKSLLETTFKSSVEMGMKESEELIGGFVLRIEDQQLDASLATQLRKVKEKLLLTDINK